MEPAEYKRVLKLMGNRFEITVVHADQDFAESKTDLAVAEIKRIELLLTTFNADSQTNQINQNAGIKPVKVDAEVFKLIGRSLKISALTQGAFFKKLHPDLQRNLVSHYRYHNQYKDSCWKPC